MLSESWNLSSGTPGEEGKLIEEDAKRSVAELGHGFSSDDPESSVCICGCSKRAAVAFGFVCKYKGLTAQEARRRDRQDRAQQAGQDLRNMLAKDLPKLPGALAEIAVDSVVDNGKGPYWHP
jgi:hypothetical protein